MSASIQPTTPTTYPTTTADNGEDLWTMPRNGDINTVLVNTFNESIEVRWQRPVEVIIEELTRDEAVQLIGILKGAVRRFDELELSED
jgi:hypothetical protein